MDDNPVFSGEFKFSYKTVFEHLRDFLAHPLPILAVSVAVFGTLWTIGEAAIQFTATNPRGWFSFGLLIGASVIISLAWNMYRYFRRIPEGFEDVAVHACRLAHLQRPLWEFRLAKSLLAQRLAPYERELRDMESGLHFVIAKKHASLNDYTQWSAVRIENLQNMLAVAQQILLNHFPSALLSTAEKPADPMTILNAVETLARFYGETVEFERSSRAVMPSEDLRELHQHQLGWSESIRDAVRQLFQFLQQICESNPKADNQISFEIEFAMPDGVSRYCDELNRLTSNIRDLESNW